MFELEGAVKLLEETQTFSSGFSKREFVITTEEKFPQDVKFECTKEKIELLTKLRPGDRVKVTFNIRGNEYKGRYYVNLQAWRVESLGGEVDESLNQAAEPERRSAGKPSSSGKSSSGAGNLDDLEESPF